MKIGGLAVLAAAVVALGACGDDEQAGGAAQRPAAAEQSGPIRVDDAAGATVELDEPAERVACMQTGCDEILADLGMVPVATWVPEKVAAYPVYYGDRAGEVELHQDEIDVEKIAATRPDLIYVREGQEKEAKQLARIAPVYTAHSGFETGPDQLKENLREMAQLVGRPAEAEAAIERFDATVEQVKQAAPVGAARTTVFAQSGYETRKYAGWFRGGFLCNTLEAEGLGRCALDAPKGAEDAYGEISAEAVLEADPDYIIYLTNPDDGAAPPEKRTDATWKRLTAVREGRVIRDGSAGMYCCGMREPAYTLALYAHEAFGAPDPGPYRSWRP
jgi:ABC-type Fe3+-hydroxamate transport system substrate-binding protein